MFDVSDNRLFNYEFPLIADNFRALLFNELPILFTGVNSLGDFIIGSSVDEDYEAGFERYFHIVVTEGDYSNYFGRKITYRQLLDQAKPVYVIDKYYEPEVSKIYHYSFDEIPSEYKPAIDSFCPESAYSPSLIYSVPIYGGIANYHHAYPKDFGSAVNNIAALLETGLASVARYLELKTNVFSRPNFASSFGMSFEVNIEKFPSLFVTAEECLDYLNQYVHYCIEQLPKEAVSFDSVDGDNPEFAKLVNQVMSLANRTGGDVASLAEIKDTLLSDVLETPEIINALAKTVSKNYSYLRISNNDFPLGGAGAATGRHGNAGAGRLGAQAGVVPAALIDGAGRVPAHRRSRRFALWADGG